MQISLHWHDRLEGEQRFSGTGFIKNTTSQSESDKTAS